MGKRAEWALVALVVLAAAALRIWLLGDVPPGLSHDEVDHWLIAREILSGEFAIYFTAAYGHEPLYHYVQAATVAAFGDNWLGLRFPSVAFGLLGLVIQYVLVRRLFGARVALVAAAWLAISFWPVSYARVGLRAIALPFFAVLAAYLLVRVVGIGRSEGRAACQRGLLTSISGGVVLGLCVYTYMASRVFPAVLLAFVVYLYLVSPRPVPWSRLVTFFLVAGVVAAPLLIWLAVHPGSEYRIGEVSEPLDRLLDGDPSLVWQNAVANLKSFFLAGDPWPHQNLPGRPIYAELPGAVLFCAGLALAVRRWRSPRHGLLLLWLFGGLAPSVVTSVAPSSVRAILATAVVFVFPALAVVEGARRLPVKGRLAAAVRWSLFLAPLALAACYTVRDYFAAWPARDDVQYFYQTDLIAVAEQLDGMAREDPVAVAGLSVDSMDGPTLELAAHRPVDEVRICDTRETLVLAGPDESWLFVPNVVPLHGDFLERLLAWEASVQKDPCSRYTSYHLPGGGPLQQHVNGLEKDVSDPSGSGIEVPVSYGGRLALLGYEWLERGSVAGGTLALLTYWRVEEPPPDAVRVFLHLTGEDGTVAGQSDGLSSPPSRWSTGDLVVQRHSILLPQDTAPGLYRLELGVYYPATLERLPVRTSPTTTTDRALIGEAEISSR
jgi:4-amino-4-deoxy-L-arabinose transferase-like glycosyltransferase